MGLGYKQFFKAKGFVLLMLMIISIFAAGMVVCYFIASRTDLHVMPSALVTQSIGNTAQAQSMCLQAYFGLENPIEYQCYNGGLI